MSGFAGVDGTCAHCFLAAKSRAFLQLPLLSHQCIPCVYPNAFSRAFMLSSDNFGQSMIPCLPSHRKHPLWRGCRSKPTRLEFSPSFCSATLSWSALGLVFMYACHAFLHSHEHVGDHAPDLCLCRGLLHPGALHVGISTASTDFSDPDAGDESRSALFGSAP